MRRTLALLLTLSMIFALAVSGGGQAFAADAAAGEEVGSEMWMLKLLAATALGDSEAMATLGLAYYKGEGVEKDLATARGWLEKAADAGNAAVLTTLGTMYLNGEGVAKDPEKAFELFTKAADAGIAEAKVKLETPDMKAISDKLHKETDKAYLAGHWGEIEWIRNGTNNPYYLDETVTDAAWVEFTMVTPCAPRGYPYGDWYLYTMDKDGNWGHVAKFALNQNMTNGKPVKIRLQLDQPTTFNAVTITSVESGMDFTLWRFIDFCVDPSCVPENVRGFVPESFENQIKAYAGKQYPLTQQTVQYQAYNSPDNDIYFYDTPNYRPDPVPYDPPNGTNYATSATDVGNYAYG